MKMISNRLIGGSSLTLLVLSQSAFLIALANQSYAADAGLNPGSMPATRIVPAPPQRSTGGRTQIATLKPGASAPDFLSKGIKNQAVHLSSFKGKVVVLDFWATWCGPCQSSLPHTQEVAKNFKDQGVVVLAVCTSDTRANYEKWMGVNQPKYPDVLFTCDPNDRGSASYDNRASKKLYGVTGIPTQFVIGKDGRIVGVLVGYDQDDVRLEATLARAGVKMDPQLVAKGEGQLKKE